MISHSLLCYGSKTKVKKKSSPIQILFFFPLVFAQFLGNNSKYDAMQSCFFIYKQPYLFTMYICLKFVKNLRNLRFWTTGKLDPIYIYIYLM